MYEFVKVLTLLECHSYVASLCVLAVDNLLEWTICSNSTNKYYSVTRMRLLKPLLLLLLLFDLKLFFYLLFALRSLRRRIAKGDELLFGKESW